MSSFSMRHRQNVLRRLLAGQKINGAEPLEGRHRFRKPAPRRKNSSTVQSLLCNAPRHPWAFPDDLRRSRRSAVLVAGRQRRLDCAPGGGAGDHDRRTIDHPCAGRAAPASAPQHQLGRGKGAQVHPGRNPSLALSSRDRTGSTSCCAAGKWCAPSSTMIATASISTAASILAGRRRICQGRDSIRSRVGGSCRIEKFQPWYPSSPQQGQVNRQLNPPSHSVQGSARGDYPAFH